MTVKPALSAAFALALTACLTRPAQDSTDAGQVVQPRSESDATAGIDAEQKPEKTPARAEDERAEKLRRQQDREAIHRQRLGVCVHH